MVPILEIWYGTRYLAEAPLVDELKSLGINVDSVFDLINANKKYTDAVPVLFRHLRNRNYPDWIRGGIARALGTSDAKYGWNSLVEEFNETADPWCATKEGLAAAILALSDDKVFDQVAELVRNKRNRLSRITLLGAIRRSKRSEAPKILEELSHDDDLVLAISSMKSYWKKHNPDILKNWESPSERKRLVLIDKMLSNERRDHFEKINKM